MTPGVRRWTLVAGGTAVALGAIAYAAVLGALYFKQERLIFPGRPLATQFQFHFDQRFEELHMPVPGATLDALHFMQDQPRGVVFFLHGNAGNLQTWTTGIEFYRRVNYDLFILDYRGYGKSLAALAHSPVELVVVEGAGHDDIHRFPSYLDTLAARLIATVGN